MKYAVSSAALALAAALGLAGCDTMHSAMSAVKNKLSPASTTAAGSGTAPAATPAAPAATAPATATNAAAAPAPMSLADAQQKLNDLGFDAGKPDGVMGPHTHAALKKFQKSRGLDETGELDAATAAALR